MNSTSITAVSGITANSSADGEWALSINPDDKNGTAELTREKTYGNNCLKISVSNTSPSVSYAINGELEPGNYTLSLDMYIEGKGSESVNFDVFDTSTGSVVRTTEGAAMAGRSVKSGAWNTVTVPFVLTGKSDVIFRFFTGSAVNFCIDNVSVTRVGY